MQPELRNRLRDNYSTIYVTIVSVMLGLALDDLVSIMRSLENISLFNWLTAAFSAHVIFNAWVGYSCTAAILRLVPSVWDALNVLALSLAHFGLNSAIGEEPIIFFYVASCYAAIAGAVTYYNVWRADQDDAVNIKVSTFRAVIGVNVAGTIGFLTAGILTRTMLLTPDFQAVIVAMALPFATLWIFVFLRVWKANGLPVWLDGARSKKTPAEITPHKPEM